MGGIWSGRTYYRRIIRGRRTDKNGNHASIDIKSDGKSAEKSAEKKCRKKITEKTQIQMEEFVREVNKNDHAELTEYLESRKEFVLEKFTQKDIIKVVGEREIFEVTKEAYIEAFDELNEIEKTIIHSYYYGKASDREIGEALGKPRSTVWEYRKAALKKMRRYLSEKEAY